MAAPPIALIAAAAARARIVCRFAEAGANTPEAARTLEDLDLTRGLIVRRLLKSGVLKESSNSRLWLDETTHAARRRRSLLTVAIVFGACALIVGILLLTI